MLKISIKFENGTTLEFKEVTFISMNECEVIIWYNGNDYSYSRTIIKDMDITPIK